MAISSEDLALFDACPKLQQFSHWEPPRLPLATVLNESLRVGLLEGSPESAKNHFMERAASPGLALTGYDIYAIAIHHAALIEIIVHYLLAGEGPWKPAPILALGEHRYKPMSYLVPDGRLRRVVLCSKWDSLRKREEEVSWRTLGDIAATARPMLINAISIGSALKGFRPSVWTRTYQHPVAMTYRIQALKDDGFNENWKRIYRESSPYRADCQGWLTLMQKDKAFDGVVNSTVVDLPSGGKELSEQMGRMLDSIAAKGEGEMRRANCFKLSPCVYAGCCYAETATSPASVGWGAKKRLP